MHLFNDKDPQFLQMDQTHTLQLTEHDTNLLLSWSLALEFPEYKAHLSLDRDVLLLRMSVPAPRGGGEPRYVNLELAGGVWIQNGMLRLRADHCRIGNLEVPHCLVHSLGNLVASWLNYDGRSKPFLDAAQELAIEPNSLVLAYRRLNLLAQFRERFLRPTRISAELLFSTRAQVDHLLSLFVANSVVEGQPSFNLCLKSASVLARNRSARRNPVAENQAAILALGILLGHPKIEEFVGPVLADHDRKTALRVPHRVLLRDRFDWTRHFWVSAAITVLSDEVLSDAAGLLKEELDADGSGSGFSFADLLANRAGTAFALAATRDEAAARILQDRLAGGFHIDDVFPSVEALPEGIADAELQSQYGGVDGEGFRRFLQEIERRVAACPAYR